MILDSLIVAIAGLFELSVILFAGFINLFLKLIELIVRIFIHGYQIKKLPTKKFRAEKTEDSNNEAQENSKSSIWVPVIVISLIALVMFIMAFKNKEIHFVAVDGNSLPFAKIVVVTEDGEVNKRTDISGKVDIPRFGILSIKISDPRYKEQSWSSDEISSQLVVKRSLLGSGLDKLSNMLEKDK